MKKLLSGISLLVPLIGGAALPDTIARAHADQVDFAPDWPNHRNQTEMAICAALGQGWSRRQIVNTAESAQFRPDRGR
jgi:hypothetical protein